MPLTPLPETVTFNLTFKNGIERTDCRKKHRPSEDMQFKVDEGYETLKGRIRQAARLLPSISLPEHFDIYCKTRRNSTFSNYTILNQSDFKTIMEQSWNSAGDGGRSRFKPEVFVYVPSETRAVASGIRRATQSRIIDAANRIEGFLESNPDMRSNAGGAMAQRYWATDLARYPDRDEQLQLPTSTTFRQLARLDADSNTQSDDQDWVVLRMRIGGGEAIPVMFNRSELRLALMLPTMTANSSTLRNHAEIQRNVADLQHQTQDPYAAEPALENNEVSDLGDDEDFI